MGLTKPRSTRRLARSLLTVAAVAALVAPAADQTPVAADRAPDTTARQDRGDKHGRLRIEVLSNRADLISGGDALLYVALPDDVDPAKVRIDVDGRDVTSSFQVGPDGNLVGLVEGLDDGDSVVRARGTGKPARITITNHPVGGPVFAGPQVQPWLCGTDAAGLGPPQDAQCNAPTRYTFSYKQAATGQFLDYDPADPPPSSDIAETTTDQGVTVPYIVRFERGTADRGIYDIAVLWDPAQPPDTEPEAWNHKLLVPFGGGSAVHHTQDLPLSILGDFAARGDLALSRGFMVATSGLNVHGSNSNQVVSAEALMMMKERVVERYGAIRYTIGAGGSGGAIQQHMIAAMYPGLLDGLQPIVSYADLWTTAQEVGDCLLLRNYFTNTSPQLWPDAAQQALVDGHQDTTACAVWEAAFGSLADPSNAASCNLPPELVYDPDTNPDGVRCTPQDYEIAVWGRRPSDDFAKRPIDNVGVQYGLHALNARQITAEQFVDLNLNVGSADIDGTLQPERIAADPGSAATAYETSHVTDVRQLDSVPIVDLRLHNNVNDIHTSFHSYVLRARLDRYNGHHDNQLIWTFKDLGEGAQATEQSLLLLDEWLAAIESDTSERPLAEKVADHKPGDAVDKCWIGGAETTDIDVCAAWYPNYGDARLAAGAPLTHDVIRCRFQPLDRAAYAVTFTDSQWSRLQMAFPTGVCDWTKRSRGYRPSVPWHDYSSGPSEG